MVVDMGINCTQRITTIILFFKPNLQMTYKHLETGEQCLLVESLKSPRPSSFNDSETGVAYKYESWLPLLRLLNYDIYRQRC